MTSFSLKVIQFFQALLIPVFLLGGAVRLVTSERFLEFEYTRRVYNSLLMLMGAAPLVLDTQIMPYLVSIYLF